MEPDISPANKTGQLDMLTTDNRHPAHPALHKLEHEGWIRGEWKESHTGRPAKFYSLTHAGRRQFRLEAANWTRLSAAINGILESV